MLTQLISLLGLTPTQDAKQPANGSKPKGEGDFADILADLEQDTRRTIQGTPPEADTEAPADVAPEDQELIPQDVDGDADWFGEDVDDGAEAAPKGGAEHDADLEAWLASLRSARAAADKLEAGANAAPVTQAARPLPEVTFGDAPATARGTPALGNVETAKRPIRAAVVERPAGEAIAAAVGVGPKVRGITAKRDMPIFNAVELTPWAPKAPSPVTPAATATAVPTSAAPTLDAEEPMVATEGGKGFPRSFIERPGLIQPDAVLAQRASSIRIAPDAQKASITSAMALEGDIDPGAPLPPIADILDDQARADASPRVNLAEDIRAMARDMSASIRIERGSRAEVVPQPSSSPAGPKAADPFMSDTQPRQIRDFVQDLIQPKEAPAQAASPENADIIPVFRSPRAARAAGMAQERVDIAARSEPEPTGASSDGGARSKAQAMDVRTKPPAAATVQVMGAQSGQRPEFNARSSSDDADDFSDFGGPAGAPAARAGAGVATSQLAHTARPETAHVMRQVAEALPRLSDGSIDIRLDPEELGRIRLHMVSTESGMTVHVAADRPETLDLMRRNIDQLARDLADAGYENATFDFGGDGQKEQGQSGRGPAASFVGGPEDTPHPQPAMTAAQDGLDILI